MGRTSRTENEPKISEDYMFVATWAMLMQMAMVRAHIRSASIAVSCLALKLVALRRYNIEYIL